MRVRRAAAVFGHTLRALITRTPCDLTADERQALRRADPRGAIGTADDHTEDQLQYSFDSTGWRGTAGAGSWC
ncbi:hypothetical protein BIV25_21465 [Streptomyces sp. MUSC 14]|nr:hypothetical protein BIV25_21465 [Streptomyces sp. MUSC 14]